MRAEIAKDLVIPSRGGDDQRHVAIRRSAGCRPCERQDFLASSTAGTPPVKVLTRGCRCQHVEGVCETAPTARATI